MSSSWKASGRRILISLESILGRRTFFPCREGPWSHVCFSLSSTFPSKRREPNCRVKQKQIFLHLLLSKKWHAIQSHLANFSSRAVPVTAQWQRKQQNLTRLLVLEQPAGAPAAPAPLMKLRLISECVFPSNFESTASAVQPRARLPREANLHLLGRRKEKCARVTANLWGPASDKLLLFFCLSDERTSLKWRAFTLQSDLVFALLIHLFLKNRF